MVGLNFRKWVKCVWRIGLFINQILINSKENAPGGGLHLERGSLCFGRGPNTREGELCGDEGCY